MKNKFFILAQKYSSRDGVVFLLKSIDDFIISPQKHMLWLLIRSTLWGTSHEYHNICFHLEIGKIFTWQSLLSEAIWIN